MKYQKEVLEYIENLRKRYQEGLPLNEKELDILGKSYTGEFISLSDIRAAS